MAYRLIGSLQNLTARWYGQGRVQPANVIVIHTTESPEKYGGSFSVARYFHNNLIKTSAHIVVDSTKAIRCVPDEDRAWAAPPLNTRGLHLELVGTARQLKSDWNDTYSKAELALAAKVCADWVEKYKIKIRRLTPAQLKAGESGFCGHADVSKAFKQSDHTDPGINFPWTEFLKAVANELVKKEI